MEEEEEEEEEEEDEDMEEDEEGIPLSHQYMRSWISTSWV
jgi:hypothetical protein